MTQAAPGFWGKYRGRVDPQAPALTPYNYQAVFYSTNNPDVQLYMSQFTVYGPPQLNKNDFVEVRWAFVPGLTRVRIMRNSALFYETNGAEQGFRDEGQFLVVNGGTQNQ